MARANLREMNRGLDQSHGSFELVVSPVIMGLGGWWLDRQFGTTPWCTIGLVVFGICGAVTKLYLDYRRSMDAVADEARSARAERNAERAAAREAADAERAELDAELAARLEAAAAADPTVRRIPEAAR